MESEQNNNNVIVLDLCETGKGSIMKKVKKSTITNHCLWNNINNIQLDNQDNSKTVYVKLYDKCFVKCTQGDIKKNTEENNNNIILQNKKGLILKKQKDTFILQNNNTGLMFDTTNRVFTFNISGLHQPLHYQASLTNILNDDNASFKLLQPSFFKNLFSPMQHSHGKNIIKEHCKRLFCGTSVNKNFPSRCCIGCFSCDDVVADNDIKNGDDTLPARISLEDVLLENSYIKYNSK